jgi:hypothetical protein
MTDRELLEFAAKAAGNGANSWSDSHKCLFTTHGPYPNEYRKWNPLADDGDALRLSTELRLNVFHTNGCAYAMQSDCDGEYEQKVSYKDAGDKHAATRRAIVRVAAEIGRITP